MGKRLDLTTRGFGGEPGVPDVADLASWIASHRGTVADLTSFLLDQSLAPQVEARITSPCAGGKFMKNRLCESLSAVQDNNVTEEIGVRTELLTEDAAGIVVQKRGAWCALPAPHALGITDRYYNDTDEWSEAIAGVYRTVMRAMRDTGVVGHVLICDKVDESEIQALARQNVFFFHPEPDRSTLEILMEYQTKVAVPKDRVAMVFDLAGEYDVRHLIIIDPDTPVVKLALSHLDPDQVVAGGYCRENCNEYWENLVNDSSFVF
jgi:hypothetical protein